MDDFQLILLSDRARPIHKADAFGSFSLIRYRSRAELMAEKLALSPDKVSRWLSAYEALSGIEAAIPNRPTAISALLRRLRHGLILTAAMCSRWQNAGDFNSDLEVPVLIPAGHWSHFPQVGSSADYIFWNTGDIRFKLNINDQFEDVAVQYFGVRFNPEGIEEMIASAGGPVSGATQIEAPSASNKSGRSRADFWDDLWADICGEIYEGTLVPNRQADIEKAMLDWATNHRHELSEAGARTRARKLFNRLQNARLKT